MVWNVIFWGLLFQTFGMASELDKIVRTDHKNLFATVHSTILTTEKTVWLHVGKKTVAWTERVANSEQYADVSTNRGFFIKKCRFWPILNAALNF